MAYALASTASGVSVFASSRRIRDTRSAFATTSNDETDMPTAANSGVNQPMAASGMATGL